MANSSNSKQKLLLLMKILISNTDEKHPMTVKEIITELKKYGIKAERKSIYTDIGILSEFGIDIICDKTRANNYYVATENLNF